MIKDNIPVSVLIVDDNPAKLTAMAAALDGMDIEITTAASGMEALRQSLAQDFAVVLLDVNMPVMDGFETAKTIRHRNKSEHLPIIFITAERLTDDVLLEGYGLGAVDYILSPVLPQILRAKVAVFADLHRLREQAARQNLMLEEQVEKRTAALRESETKYRLLIESLREGIWMIDKDADTSFVNSRMAQMLGYSVKEMHGRHLFSFMDERGKEIATRNLERRKQGISEQHDFELLRKDGSRIYTSMATSPILDEDGNYAGALAGVTDITERKQLEQQLSRRLRHRDIMEHITQISLNSASIEDLLEGVLDEMLTVFNADRAWFLYPCDPDARSWSVPMERTRPEWPGAFVRGMEMPVTPEVIEVFRELLASTHPLPYGPAESRCIPAVVAEQFSIRSAVQMALRPRVGSPWVIGLHHCAQARAYDEDALLIFKDIGGRVADALGSMIILKNLRESEERLRAITDNAGAVIFMKDIAGRYLHVNRQYEKLFHVSNATIQGKTDYDIFPRDIADAFARNDQMVVQSGQPLEVEEQVPHDDGIHTYISVKFPLRGASGGIYAVCGISTDITERKHAEAELNKHQQLLRELEARNLVSREAELKHIAREMHDELGQILTALRLDVTLVNLRFGEQNAPLLAKTQEMIVLLDKAARCVHDIVSNLRPAALDIGLVPAIKWLCDEHAARSGSSCVLHTIEEHVDLDEARAVAVFRIVQELLTNAARHADASSITITLTRHAADLHVVVRDNGKGFDPAATAAKNSFGLLGIRERAIALRGEVDLVSAPNQGTAVTVIVPTNPNGDNK